MSLGKNQPSGQTTTTTSQAPWAGQVPNLNTLNSSASNLLSDQIANSGSRWQAPSFQQFADPTQQQNQAISAQTNLAQNDPTMQAATSGINPYLNGSMLSGGNPYLGNAFNSAAQAVLPQVQSGFESNGRYGSGAMANAQASALTNLAGNMAYQNYTDQSTNQLKAMLEAPGISQGNFADISQLGAAGAQQQAFNQMPISQAVSNYYANQQLPFQQLQAFGSTIGAPITGGGTQSSPYFTNPVGSALGTGLGALALYNGANTATNGGVNSGVSSLWSSLFGSGAGAGASAGADVLA